ncbi:DUF881 domain-containing protein [Bacillus alkalicellulosilyticus]|uniref:DUF881 domain-containing protein n=1 Tax=Alkalihalobacterium alkalicellulosilyticum TaxID=1912214 RepID=UPI000998B5B8|nr:DUF881 domain-containing protein [Bacillus alkalicellulosilyticus]
MKDHRHIFTFVLLIIGFMLAVQFQSTKEPVVRDTRDIRELRTELQAEQERHQQLVQEIDNTLVLLQQYENSFNDQQSVEEVIEEQIESLKEGAGLTEKSGEGITIKISTLGGDPFYDSQRQSIPPHLLRFLVNELNINSARDIAIANHRVVSTTAFREVQGVTQLNGGRRIPPLPVEVKVLADDAENLHNHMVVSESVKYFELEGYSLTFTIENEITLPPYEQTPRVRFMEQVKEE